MHAIYSHLFGNDQIMYMIIVVIQSAEVFEVVLYHLYCIACHNNNIIIGTVSAVGGSAGKDER